MDTVLYPPSEVVADLIALYQAGLLTKQEACAAARSIVAEKHPAVFAWDHELARMRETAQQASEAIRRVQEAGARG